MDHTQSQAQWCLDKAAIIPCGSWLENEQKDAPKTEGFEFAMFPEPLLSNDSKLAKETLRASPGEPYVVPAAAKNPKGGLEYMRIMLSEEGAKGFTQEVSSLTVVKDSAEGVELPPGLTSAKAALGAGDNVVDWMWQDWYGDMWNPGINSVIGDLMAGRKTVDEFCEGAEAESRKVREDDSITKYTR
jgi:N-acetylglucosamine transport system substrate-binding protein